MSKNRHMSLAQRVLRCEREIERLRNEQRANMYKLAKEILRNPEKIAEEIKNIEDTEKFIEEIINY